MSRSSNKMMRPVMVGVFLLVMVALIIALVLFVGQGKLSGNNKKRMVVIYDTSIMGLSIGAPVTLRGVKIGEVSDIKAKLYNDPYVVLNSVYVDIYPDTLVSEENPDYRFELNDLYERGIGVKLKSQSFLTGLLYMEVDFYRDSAARQFPVKTKYPQLPTVPSDLESITQDFHNMNFPDLVTDIRTLSKNLSDITGTAEFRSLPAEFNQAMRSFELMAVQMGTSMTDMRNEFVGMARGMEICR